MMIEVHKAWQQLDPSGGNIKARFIRHAANVWAHRPSSHISGW
jgi:hypothetical protein